MDKNHLKYYKRSVSFYKLDNEFSNEYVDIYKWMNSIFKHLNSYTTDTFPLSTFYGTSMDNIILEQDLKFNELNIHWEKVYLVFESTFGEYFEYREQKEIFHEYFVNTLHLKVSRTEEVNMTFLSIMGCSLRLKEMNTFQKV